MFENKNESRLEWFGWYLIIASAFFPGACVAGIFPAWNVFSTAIWLGIAGVGAGLGGSMVAPPGTKIAGLVGGAAAGIGIVAAISAYAKFRMPLGKKILDIEFMIPFFLGSLPGMGIYWILARITNYRQQEL